MKGTKEFYEIMDQFEREVRKVTYGHKVERVGKDEKVPTDVFYQDGHINQLFQMYMRGYAHAKNKEIN